MEEEIGYSSLWLVAVRFMLVCIYLVTCYLNIIKRYIKNLDRVPLSLNVYWRDRKVRSVNQG